MLPQNALLKTRSVNGKASLGILQNSPPTPPCEIDNDCEPGKACHMSISITGAPARELLKTLKERVSPNQDFKQLGLTVYSSKDDLLDCDETDISKPFCRISFNPPKLQFEQAPVCE
jgi:hypothetical protein